MDGDRPPAGRQSAGSWQCNVDGLTADGLTGCMLLCNAPAVTTPTQGSDLWRGTVSLCHSLFMQDTTCYKWEVEAVLNHRDVAAGRLQRRQYLVKWVGYSTLHNTWEPAEHLDHAMEEVDRYLERANRDRRLTRRSKRAHAGQLA